MIKDSPHTNSEPDVDSSIQTNLTGISILMMGIIDAYAIVVKGTLVSSQTGNLVILARELFAEDWSDIWKHIIVFIGFALGAFSGKAVHEALKSRWMRFRLYLLFQAALLLVVAILQNTLPETLLVFLLALLAGYDLALFRKFGDTNVNNGVMTGNTKDLMSYLFLAIYYKDKEARKHSGNVFLAITIFCLGSRNRRCISHCKPAIELMGMLYYRRPVYIVADLCNW